MYPLTGAAHLVPGTGCCSSWRNQWPPDKGSGPAYLLGADVAMAAGGGGASKRGSSGTGKPDLGGVTKAPPQLGDTIGLVVELVVSWPPAPQPSLWG